MTDIVERLRKQEVCYPYNLVPLFLDAADEIERLRNIIKNDWSYSTESDQEIAARYVFDFTSGKNDPLSDCFAAYRKVERARNVAYIREYGELNMYWEIADAIEGGACDE